jgi:hypothetical protein
MITINFVLITVGTSITDRITESMHEVPRVHEMVQIGSDMWRVEDVTHDINTQEIFVRAFR